MASVDYPKRHLLSDVTVCRELGISQRTLQRHLLTGKIEAPVGKIAKNRRGWSRAEIDLLREQLTNVAEQKTGSLTV
jgi:predicted site-specific integrase-resolvase